MSKIREQVLQDILEIEFWHTYTEKKGKRVYTYEKEFPEYKKQLESEGSDWIVLVYDCLNEYYLKNKKRLDKEVSEILLRASKESYEESLKG